ncbi:hypothetical protein H4S03_002306 [Coemansia sp. S3946]|nr:hypothetical protein H4S03_002306 [Coemansia sp. S3946]
MDSDEITYTLCSIDNLIRENRELRARLEVVEQKTNTLPLRPAIAQSPAKDDEQKPDELVLIGNNDVEPLSKRRLDSIRRDVGDRKSTWANLRQLYPPRQSDFAPLMEIDDLDVDGALSQAATMAAYGSELLRIAFSGTQVNRRLTRQTSQLLSSLCSALIDTRDQRRRSQSKNANSDTVLESVHKRAKQTIESMPQQQKDERPNVSASSSRTSLELCDSSCSELTDLDSEYSLQEQRRHSRCRKRSTPRASPDDSSTIVSACDPVRTGDSATKEPASDSDHASVSGTEDDDDESDLILGQGKVMRLHRLVVIRNAFLSHGLTESDATAFLERLSKATNIKYNGIWNRWVAWCDCQGVDPLKRSEENLATYFSGGTWSKSSMTNIRAVLRSVWSVIEGDI